MAVIKRVLSALALSLLVSVALAPAALAAGPVREKLIIPTPGTIEGICDFTVVYTVAVNNEYNKNFYDASGKLVRTLTDGRLVVTFTNATKPLNSLTLNVSGPAQTVYNADGSQTITFLGNSAIFLADQIMLSSGRVVVIAPDALSVGVVVLAAGTRHNLCTMLS
jgi:hypothetical protein